MPIGGKFVDRQVSFFQSSSWSLLLFLFFIIFLLIWLSKAPSSNKNQPPSPPKLPVVGHLHLLLSLHPHRSLFSLAKRYGPIISLRIGIAQAVLISSADAAREIMKTYDLIFANRFESKTSRKLLYDLKEVAAAPYGEHWRQLKSIFVLHLLSNKRVQSFRDMRAEESALLMSKIKESCCSFQRLNLTEMFASVTNNVACRASLGRKYSGGQEGKKFRDLLKDFLMLLGSANVEDFLPWLSWINGLSGRDAKVDRVAKGLDAFLEGVVEESIMERAISSSSSTTTTDNGESREDFVSILLRIQKDNEAGLSLDRDSIKALILDIFAAGTETTSTVLEWAMTELLRHPTIMKKLQHEVRGIVKGNPEITEDDLEKMQYLKAVLKETLRCHPPIPILVPREARQDVKVMGYDIAAGTMVLVNVWAIGRDPGSWDDPDEFRPERFLSSAVDFKGHDFQFIPFGAGRRGCPGIAFAMITIELVLANVVNKFDWKLPGGAKGEDLDMSECTGVTIRRKYPLQAIATPCSHH